jgi:hypothetical protein
LYIGIKCILIIRRRILFWKHNDILGGKNMGSVSFSQTVVASSAREGYEMLVEDARDAYGSNRYNGKISTCDMGREKKSFPVYNDASRTATYEFIRNDGNGNKWVADYVDMGVKHYIVRELQTTTKKADAKYKMQYAVCDYSGIIRPVSKHTFDERAKAVEDAKAQAVAGKDGVTVCKMPIKQSGCETVMEVKTIEKIVPDKPKRVKKGQTVIPMHVYCFYGWASK